MRFQALGVALLVAMPAALPLCAQMNDNHEKTLSCDKQGSWNDRGHFCEIREQTLPAMNALNVDGGTNGGVSVKGWNRGDILVRAMVQTNAPTDSEAKSNASQVRVSTSGGQIKADAPDFGNDHGYAVSYEVFVPHSIDLKLKAHNGGVAISDVRGRIDFETTNGGASLNRLAGTVHGHTQNGGLKVLMMGDRWDGTEFDASTTNGGVQMSVPASYNARLETSTVNGGISLDFPVTVSGKISRELAVNLGSGGPLVRVTTVNGGVKIQRI